MKRFVLPGLVLVLFVATAVTFAQSGGEFDLTWSTVDGCGGSSPGLI